MNVYLEKCEKITGETIQDNKTIEKEVDEINQANDDYARQNDQLKKDYDKCQIHLENLMKNNVFIREELEKYLREDEQAISVLRKKRLPSLETFVHMRESRKNTARTFDQY